MICCASRVRANRPARKHKIAIRTIAIIASVVTPETNLSGMIAVTGFKARRAKSNALSRMKTSTTIGVEKQHAAEDGNPKKMGDCFHLVLLF